MLTGVRCEAARKLETYVARKNSPTQPGHTLGTPDPPSVDLSGESDGQKIELTWLGRRDSNPDTQIQSSLKSAPAQSDQQLSPANLGEVGQNPQHARDAGADLVEIPRRPRLEAPSRPADFDFEEDTLP